MKSKIVLGTVQFGLNYGINNVAGCLPENQIFEILNLARDLDIKELDTADGYGNAVSILKKYTLQNPNSFSLMSKFSNSHTANFVHTFHESLAKLGVRTLEVYYFHKFSDFLNFDQFNQIELLKKSGELKSLGVSIYSNDELKIAIENPFVDVIQLPFNILDHSEEKINLLAEAKQRNKKVYSRSVFLQGLFFMNPDILPTKLLPLRDQLFSLRELAFENKMSMEALCLNYVLHKSYIDRVLIGIDTKEHLIKNMNAIDANLSSSLIHSVENIIVNNSELLDPRNWK